MEILEQKLVIRDKTIERLKLELDEVTKLNELLEKKLNEHMKIEPKKIPIQPNNLLNEFGHCWTARSYRSQLLRCKDYAIEEGGYCKRHTREIIKRGHLDRGDLRMSGSSILCVDEKWNKWATRLRKLFPMYNGEFIDNRPEHIKLKYPIKDEAWYWTETKNSVMDGKDGTFQHIEEEEDGSFIQPKDIGEFVHTQSDILMNPKKTFDPDYINQIIETYNGSIQATFIYHKQPQILMYEQCLNLINYINTYDSKEHDFKLNITKDVLIELIGETICNTLLTMYDGYYNSIYIRKVLGDKSLIDFHKDYSKRTMKIALNDPTEYEGGDLVYLSDGCIHIPEQVKGSITIHTNDIIHGVTPIVNGCRYSLFILHTPNT